MSKKKLARGTLLLKNDVASINYAARIIRRGGTVAFPTETVYGLGASALDPAAIEKVFQAKGRPTDNPLIVHIENSAALASVASFVPDMAYLLAEHFWPGPLSLVLLKSDFIPPAVCAGLSTVAVRVPDNHIALDLIRASAVPIAAPSANRSGRPSPTSWKHVLKDLAGSIDAVIRSPGCVIGVESTVLDLTSHDPVILRPGGVTREELEQVLSQKVAVAGASSDSETPLSPGTKYRHYTPEVPLILVTGSGVKVLKVVKALRQKYETRGLKIAVLEASLTAARFGRPADVKALASGLYGSLRSLENSGVDLIIAAAVKPRGIGMAVMNRLYKAADRVIKVC